MTISPQQILWRATAKIDWWLVGSIFFLLSISLTLFYSIGTNSLTINENIFSRQLIYAILGISIFFIFSFIDIKFFKLPPFLLLAMAIFLLILVLIFGTTIKGTTGWFVIAGLSVQPVEFVKVLYILFFSSLLKHNWELIKKRNILVLTGLSMGILVILIIAQPDLGSSLILILIWFLSLIFFKIPKKYLFTICACLLMTAILSWFFILKDYQKLRLTTFLRVDEDALGASYNLKQALVAVGSGQLFGRGLGLGTQSQLNFLPEVSTDFIFAALAEEMGFIGAVAVIATYGIIFFRLWKYLQNNSDSFSFILLVNTLSYISIQTFLTIGMNVGILPITGLPLPLISAGGSSLFATLILLGLAHNVYVHRNS